MLFKHGQFFSTTMHSFWTDILCHSFKLTDSIALNDGIGENRPNLNKIVRTLTLKITVHRFVRVRHQCYRLLR